MSHDPGDEDDGIVGQLEHAAVLAKEEATYRWFESLKEPQYATTETMAVASQRFVEQWFGKRDDETLSDAMERVANEPAPFMRLNPGKNCLEVVVPGGSVTATIVSRGRK